MKRLLNGIIGAILAIAWFLGIVFLSAYIMEHIAVHSGILRATIFLVILFSMATLSGLIYDFLKDMSGQKTSG